MPRPSAQPARLACDRRRGRARSSAIGLACAALLLAACSGGGGGGGATGAGAATASTPTPASGSASVTLAWANASGPVAGYSVYVQRESGVFKHEADVRTPQVRLSGAPGSSARVIVVAFDAMNQSGPSSPTSPPFTFPTAGASAQSASAAGSSGASSASAALAASSGSVLPASASTSGSTATTASASSGSGGQSAGQSSSSSANSSQTQTLVQLTGGGIVWQAGNAYRLTNAAIETTRLFAPPAGAQLAGVADFDGDGQADLLWVGASSDLAYMPGSELRGSGDVSVVPLATLAADERVLGAGDFDGDGHGDVLVASGDAVHALLIAPGAAPVVSDLGTSAGATVAGIADFDANGSDDIAWRTSDGSLVLWLMDAHGTAHASVAVPLAAGLDVDGIGDFDGDGAAEIALRDSSGVYILHPLAATPALQPTDLANASTWQGVGAVDLDRNGTDDLVLAMPGAIRIASMPGDQILALDPQSPWVPVGLLP